MIAWRDALMQELTGQAGLELEADVPLAKRTTFGIGGPADVLATAHDDEAVHALLRAVARHRVPLFVLGGGSNLLVADRGVRGVVLTLAGALAELRIEDDGKRIVVGCGCTFPRLTKTALDLGWPGAIGWMGTPGQVGGAVIMNAGSAQGELGADVVEVTAISADGTDTFDRDRCRFSYRSSVFQAGAANTTAAIDRAIDSFDTLITSVDHEVKRYVLTRTILQCDKAQTSEAMELTARAHELLARRHRTQPKLRSAGSLFKNPVGDYAGRLIEAAGLKGFTMGRAQVSTVHANFVVNLGGATAADVIAVASYVLATVEAKFGVALEWEVRRVGDFSAGGAA